MSGEGEVCPRNPLTGVRTPRKVAYMNTQTITADQIVTGNHVITASRKRPVEIIGQLSAPENADYFEFAALATNGGCALRLHRSETVELVLS
jgi:hypothetical protein